MSTPESQNSYPDSSPADQSRTMNAYQRIKKAAMTDSGVRLSAEDVWHLYWGDTGIRHVADDSDGWVGMPPETCGSYAKQARAAKERRCAIDAVRSK